MTTRLRRLLCFVLTRHADSLRHYERQRVALKCTNCGAISPGWNLDLRDGASSPSCAASRWIGNSKPQQA